MIGQQLEFALLFKSLLANRVPTVDVTIFVFSIVSFFDVQRIMRRVIGDVKEKRLLDTLRFFEKLDRVIRLVVRRIEIFVGNCKGFSVQAKRIVTSKKVCSAAEVPEVTSEAAVGRFILQVPFSDHHRMITGGPQRLG